MSSYGIRVETGRAIATQEASRKLYDILAEPTSGTQQYTLEAWVANANAIQEGPARIVNYSANSDSRNFGLGQVIYYYNFRNRTVSPESNGNGNPALQTADADRDAQATLQHVVVTYDQYRGRRVYVNGTLDRGRGRARALPALELEPEPPHRDGQRRRATTGSGRARSAWSPSTGTRSPTRRSSRTSLRASASAS